MGGMNMNGRYRLMASVVACLAMTSLAWSYPGGGGGGRGAGGFGGGGEIGRASCRERVSSPV